MSARRFRIMTMTPIVACAMLGACSAPHRTLKPMSRFARLGDRQVHYIDVGAGKKTIVFIHGWATDQTIWSDQVHALREKVRMLLVDLPGHGRSEEPQAPYTMNLFASAALAVMDDAGVEEAILVGYSMGTGVIRQLWRRSPKRAQALIIVDGPLRQMQAMPLAMVKAFMARLRAPNYKDTVEQLAAQTPGVSDEIRERIKQLMQATSQSATVGGIEASLDPSIWKDDLIRVPTLCIMTDSTIGSMQLGTDYEAYVRKLVPDVDYRVLEDANHFVLLSDPQRVTEVILDYLSVRGLIAGQ